MNQELSKGLQPIKKDMVETTFNAHMKMVNILLSAETKIKLDTEVKPPEEQCRNRIKIKPNSENKKEHHH